MCSTVVFFSHAAYLNINTSSLYVAHPLTVVPYRNQVFKHLDLYGWKLCFLTVGLYYFICSYSYSFHVLLQCDGEKRFIRDRLVLKHR